MWATRSRPLYTSGYHLTVGKVYEVVKYEAPFPDENFTWSSTTTLGCVSSPTLDVSSWHEKSPQVAGFVVMTVVT